MPVRTARLVIRPLRRADVEAIAIWQPFADPVLARYNVPDQSAQERDDWYALRTGDPARREFAIEASGQVIGRISLRDVDGHGSARLGISVGAEFANHGLGAEALSGFLDWYFGKGGFGVMVLDVSAANRRAVHVYQKLGFRHVQDLYQPVGDEAAVAFLDDPRYTDLRVYFRRKDGQTEALFYEMKLTCEEWLERKEVIRHG
jgi:RimJ/RimL family protein N-acetyltransferase